MFIDYFKIPWKQMKRRKLRSLLTLLGIVIGITAVIALITLGQGLENAISQQFEALGNDKLFITAKGSALTPGLSIDAVKITEDDLEVIERTSGIKETAGMIFTTSRIEYNDNVRYFIISGMPTDPKKRALLGESQSYTLMKGRFLEKGDGLKAVLGYQYTQPTLFGQEVDVGDKILIQNTELKVVGFWNKIGSPPDDQSITIPLETYYDLFGGDTELGFIVAQTQPGEDPLKVGEKVERELRKSRDVEEGKEDFNVETPEQLAGTFNIILDIVQIVLIGIAGISLVVGGVGIMNTMYTTVLERTKEIGVLKALGAQNKNIMYLFVVESGLYGLGGGMIGALFGIGIAKLVELVFIIAVGPAFLSIEISWTLIIFTLLFSFIVGCLSGLAPARRASKLHPVDSLRYE
jgi:putative ABC transport system permease protein